jgi:ribosomal protein L19
MLSHFLGPHRALLTLQLRQSIVVRYQKHKSIFDTTSYNPDWIPRASPYHKQRKPRMDIWSDPNQAGPYLIPSIRHRMNNFKSYMKDVIEKEIKDRAECLKEYQLAPIRPGDIVDITYQETLESEALVTRRACVLAFKRRNSLTAGLLVVVRLAGMNIKAMYLIHSPKVKKIALVGKGSGNFRGNLKHRWRKITKTNVVRPKIRNRVMKSRTGIKAKPKTKGNLGMEYDKVKSDNVKRIINNI